MEIRVQVKSGARKETVKILSEDRFVVSVKEKALRNQANGRIQEIFANMYHVPVVQVRIITGKRGPNKCLHIKGL